jgi:hypothetical protein
MSLPALSDPFQKIMDEAMDRAIQRQVLPLLQPVMERLKFVTIPEKTKYDDESMSTLEMARLLGVAPITAEMWRAQGRGPSFFHAGRKVRYWKRDVIAFAEANKGLIGRKGRPPQALVEQVRSGSVLDGPHSAAGRARKAAVAGKGEK